jgi:large conductance mechanosensitive channel
LLRAGRRDTRKLCPTDQYPLASVVEDYFMDSFKKVAALDPTKKAFSLLDEFKNFAFKGNVIDLAVAVIIGAAFGAIIKSLVDNIIMPLVNLVVPGTDSYKDLGLVINGKFIPTGIFIADVINFLIVALALFFFIVKFLGWVMKNRKEEAAAPPPSTKDQELLTEIRDLLAKRQPLQV